MAEQQVIQAGFRNNLVAFLDHTAPRARQLAGIIHFLKRSRIHRAISTECPAYYSHQREFWSTANLDHLTAPREIRGTILGRNMVITEEIIRRVLEFGDSPNDKVNLNQAKVRGCFLRCGYSGDLSQGVLNKACLSPEYKYLAHILIHCLSPRKAGFDVMRESIQNAFAALVLNLPFNFSRMVFVHLTENLMVKREKFLMYARFVQMCIDDQLPDLPKTDDDIIPLERMTDYTAGSMQVYKGRDRPAVKRLIGHLGNAEYVAPPHKRWRNEGSDSGVEDMVVPDDSEEEGEVTSQLESVAVNVLEEEEEEAGDAEGFELRPRKRVEPEPSTAEPSRKTPKRARFILKPLPPREPQNPQPTQPTPPPQPSTQTTTQTTLAAAQGSSSSGHPAIHPDVAKEIHALQSVAMKLVADNVKHQEVEKKMMAQMREMAAQMMQMNQRIDSQQGEIVQLKGENARLRTLEEEYANLQRSIYADDDGLVRFRTEEESEAQQDRIEGTGAGTSGTAPDS